MNFFVGCGLYVLQNGVLALDTTTITDDARLRRWRPPLRYADGWSGWFAGRVSGDACAAGLEQNLDFPLPCLLYVSPARAGHLARSGTDDALWSSTAAGFSI